MKANVHRKKTAFTLVELLVVISLIAMLMSIVLPALRATREQARKVLCMANLSQWGELFTLYAEDHDGRFFAGYYSYADPSGVLLQSRSADLWPYAMQAYYDTPKLKFCPAARQTYGTGKSTSQSGQAETILSGSYGLNGWVCDTPPEVIQTEGHDTQYSWRTIDVVGGYKIPLFLDALWYTGRPEDSDVPPQSRDYLLNTQWAAQPDNQMQRFCVDWHRNMLNVLFPNGDVSAVSPKELWRLKWHKGFDTSKPLPQWPEWMVNFKDPD
ncbi:MAG TPA: type II secretion system protein [Anaerohalosphaeraceae bacterium]|nr:type II secretion system protein [Phycisphaerae bacterium]HOK95333.1 type II secretion system protein [Anaerohalosphaeraceae bacterium]HOL32333.1 type II secretion system protein [Anaerohalosphaeraceae bacterium]HOM74934.1 type II secretion system protein [Anaerohalosphaeraceae bacterium]HPC64931.1 type II secretion system protein [Anaerohalosphaeraceae bacterium]